MSSQCDKCSSSPEESNSFTRFARLIMKSFIMVTSIVFLSLLRNNYLNQSTTMFYYAVFILLATVIFSLIGLSDSYVFNNIVIGMGIALGMELMNHQKLN